MPWRSIGQEPARRFLAGSLEAGRIAHAYLLTGPANCGKTTLALDFARALLCAGSPKPCDVCPECRMVLGMGHPDLEQVESEDPDVTDFTALWTPNVGDRPRRALRIERVRELTRLVAMRPTQAPYRVATLDGSMVQDAAASALLKLFEEPSPRMVLLLRATAVEALPPPIASRCQTVRLGPAPTAVITGWLERELGLAPDAALDYAALGNGRPGLARRLAESPGALEALNAQAMRWLELLSADTMTRLDQAATWGRTYATARAALDLAGVVWHELLQAAAYEGSGETAAAPGALPASPLRGLQAPAGHQARAAGAARLGAQLGAIARASRALDANAQPRLVMEWLHLELPSPVRQAA